MEMRSQSDIDDLMKVLENIRNLAQNSSCIETISRCNDLIVKSIKLALKKASSKIEGLYSLNQLKRAGLPSWYMDAVCKACCHWS